MVLAMSGTANASGKKGSSKLVSVTMWGGEPSFDTNWTKNLWSQYVKKHWGLTFKISLTPTADVTTKQPLLMASGGYPDVIWNGSFTPEDALKYGSEHVIVPLNGLLKKYAPNVWHQIQTEPGFKQDIEAPNGKIYALPPYNYCPHCGWIYDEFINIKDLSQFHLKMPRTTAQFAHVLSVFKQHGLTPITGSDPVNGGGYGEDLVTYIMNAFEPYDGPGTNYLIVNNNKKVQFAAAEPGWRQGLEYLHSLYQAGDFSKLALTQQATAITALANQHKVGVIPNGGFNAVESNYGEAGSDWADWAAMPVLKGPSGLESDAYVASGNGVGTLCFAITNKATKTQEIRLMKMINYMWTNQGFLRSLIGPAYWSKPSPGSTGLTPGPAIWTTNNAMNKVYSQTVVKQNQSWFQWGLYYDGITMRDRQESPPPLTPNGDQTALQLWTEAYYAGKQSKYQLPPSLFVPLNDAQTYGTEATNLTNYVEQWTDEFITGAKSLTSQWSTYLNGLNSLGLKSFLTTTQQAAKHAITNTHVPADEGSPSDVKFLLCKGPVQPLQKQYMIEGGIPASDFNCSK